MTNWTGRHNPPQWPILTPDLTLISQLYTHRIVMAGVSLQDGHSALTISDGNSLYILVRYLARVQHYLPVFLFALLQASLIMNLFMVGTVQEIFGASHRYFIEDGSSRGAFIPTGIILPFRRTSV
jgi:hypothetical protein